MTQPCHLQAQFVVGNLAHLGQVSTCGQNEWLSGDGYAVNVTVSRARFLGIEGRR